MAKAMFVCIALGCMLAAAPASAHHGPSVLGTVRTTHPVLVRGEVIQPGTYEIRLTGKHLDPLPGQSKDAAQEFELVRDGMVVARDFAEVLPAPAVPVGTSGGSQARPRVERLRGNEFLRVSTYRDGERILIHLAVAK